MTLEILQYIWFMVFVVLLTGYAILDGFDLGVGILHLFSSKDHERRLMLNSIGPVWDGNEVWLVTAGGALFAGFPAIYATLCSAFYIPLMILLAGLIFRAVAIEFRSKQPMAWWRWMWDVLFSVASLVIALGLGVVLGNMIRGLPLDKEFEFTGNFFHFLDPYALLIGVFVVALFSMHGCIYLLMKTEGELHDRIRTWVNPTIIFYIMTYALATVATLIFQPHMVTILQDKPELFLVAVLNMFAVANIPREISKGNDGKAFLSSAFNIIFLFILYGVGTFPNFVRNIADPANSMTIFNSSSSEKTLGILMIFALIGVPMVIGYTTAIYYIFRGKVRLESNSY